MTPNDPATARHCQHCGEQFTPEDPDDTMCSWACADSADFQQIGTWVHPDDQVDPTGQREVRAGAFID